MTANDLRDCAEHVNDPASLLELAADMLEEVGVTIDAPGGEG